MAVRRFSLDLPGGAIRTKGGEILLRTKGQAYRGKEFESLVLRSRPDGTHLRLGDVATVIDVFAETDQSAQFDAEPTVTVKVYRVGDQNALDITEKVKAYINNTQQRMPDGIKLTVWADSSRILNDRLELMLHNGQLGFILVFIALTMFLRLRLAFWVALGIPISFLGAIGLMPFFDISINMISLFAFIVVLGIVVDDAVIVGENIYRHYQMGKRGLRAAIDGAQEVYVPVIFAILTSIAAFSPLLTVEGSMGKIMRIIPMMVIPHPHLFTHRIALYFTSASRTRQNRFKKRQRSPRANALLSALWQRVQNGVADGLLIAVDADRIIAPFSNGPFNGGI